MSYNMEQEPLDATLPPPPHPPHPARLTLQEHTLPPFLPPPSFSFDRNDHDANNGVEMSEMGRDHQNAAFAMSSAPRNKQEIDAKRPIE